MSDDRMPRLTRRGFLAGTIAAALVACSDDDSGSSATTRAAPPHPTPASSGSYKNHDTPTKSFHRL